ncbi:helix-turn-helix domain-containing protein [Streptomyces fungicidicus]|uniref:helix-turn-helix domain-containing protein n=1 Tax=Streptomyces fungicidicus TaxID=68203 RepID=UPI0036332D5E
MGQIEQGLERALRTRPVPSSSEARLRFLLATHQGSTRRVAAVLGVSQRTVQRWVSPASYPATIRHSSPRPGTVHYPPKAAVALVRDAASGVFGVARIARQLRDWTAT